MTTIAESKTCEMDGHDYLLSGAEMYWHCENPAVWTGQVELPGFTPPRYATMSLCEEHFDEYHDSLEE